MGSGCLDQRLAKRLHAAGRPRHRLRQPEGPRRARQGERAGHAHVLENVRFSVVARGLGLRGAGRNRRRRRGSRRRQLPFQMGRTQRQDQGRGVR